MFRIFLGAALALSGCLWALAIHSGGSVLEFRTAAQIFGWSCLASILLGFLAVAGRTQGFRHHGRPSLALVGASVITFLTGVVVLYVSYFEWGDPPRWIDAQAETATASADWQQHLKFAEKPLAVSTDFRPTIATSTPQAKVQEKHRAPKEVVAAPAPQPRVELNNPCSSPSGIASLQCMQCGHETGLSRLMCDLKARGEYCEGREGSDPACPSVIPSSPPY